MIRHIVAATLLTLTLAAPPVLADQELLTTHCGKCHGGKSPKGDFDLRLLGKSPDPDNVDLWETSLDYVKAEEMPPAGENHLSAVDRQRLVRFLRKGLQRYSSQSTASLRTPPRRLNNREFRISVSDVLMIEDIGTHQPTDNLIGDTLHEGFDTHGESLGFSTFHYEQFIEAIRSIVDATILVGDRPQSHVYEFDATQIIEAHARQNIKRPERRGTPEGFDFLDPQNPAYFEGFEEVPATGWYRIRIRCTGKDRGLYHSGKTGIYDGDPIRLSVTMGDRERVFDLPDEKVAEFTLNEWLAAGTRLRLHYPTDGLRLRGNGNFKFQHAITGEHLKEHDPELHAEVVASIRPNRFGRVRPPSSWHHWVDYWMGPRPRIFSAQVEGPFYESWPPQRQIALIGRDPSVENAETILRPIAERAWRRDVRPGELAAIVRLVESHAGGHGNIEAMKEGIVAILASPPFLLLNTDDLTSAERFASKFSYFLASTLPDAELRDAVAAGDLNTYEGVRAEVQRWFDQGRADPFLQAFPFGWLKLNDINFMAPDPDRYRMYHRKRISEDMTAEALAFFRHAVDENIPVTDFLAADYSFINADLAQVYGAENIPEDSELRKYTFPDGRRGGLLGMGAFLTVTADSLGTSPIHRAIYVMENFLGIHPDPPPPDVEIEEPDVRSARTIKEVLEAHRSDTTCAACHQSIDPCGYAFENFDPMGAWRDEYPLMLSDASTDTGPRSKRNSRGVPIDASATFRNGANYQDITEFRQLMQTKANRERFVRCFVTKLLTYANGREPDNYAEVERIVELSAEKDYRIVDTIAAVIHSPLFREEKSSPAVARSDGREAAN
ncbi:hypothetical protein Mal4_18720 [Maioricimonas rarisocia]|uniref:Planctomycete cytochrome C n=1 Tax=Maioricimonas rarisocia TaxID=2528026 RepID=A0A517Z4Z6_9PLAN|nr:DUF1592 domain-containing protein [Maioricimonas rarisocia]QDU37558.1 hypothetical protein Mal4_18720 [Maioricimonas rarisocia]